MSHYLKRQEALISSCTFSLLNHLGGIGKKGASPWHGASHFEVWNKTLFSKAVECTCNRFNLTAAAVSYLSFVWFIFPLGVGAPGRDGNALLTFPSGRISELFTPVQPGLLPVMGRGGGLSLPVLTQWVRHAQVWPTKCHRWFVLVWASAVTGRRSKFPFDMLLF